MAKDLTIIPIRDNGGKPVGWEMKYGNEKGNGPDNYPRVILDKGSGKHDFTISIQDANGIAFARGTNHWKDGDNALWVHEGTTSPTQKGLHPQIHSVKLHNNTQLTFEDSNNGQPVTLAYQLNFVGAPPLDPIIQNGGGTGPGVYGWEMLAVAFVAGVAATFALMWLRKMINNRGTPS